MSFLLGSFEADFPHTIALVFQTWITPKQMPNVMETNSALMYWAWPLASCLSDFSAEGIENLNHPKTERRKGHILKVLLSAILLTTNTIKNKGKRSLSAQLRIYQKCHVSWILLAAFKTVFSPWERDFFILPEMPYTFFFFLNFYFVLGHQIYMSNHISSPGFPLSPCSQLGITAHFGPTAALN